MGVYLAKPATEKYTAQAASFTLEYGASSMQGWRTAQEDAHCCHLDVDCGDTSVFGVFDGHGGADISRFCADRLLNILTELESYKSGNIEKALEEAFLLLDKTLLEDNVRQQLMEVRSKADQGKNGSLRDDENEEEESSEASDVSGDDPAQLKAEAEMSMADLIARIVKPKKGSPFLYKKAEKPAAGTSKLVSGENGAGSTNSPLTTASSSSGRKRSWCTAKETSNKEPQEECGSSSSSVMAVNSEEQQQQTSSDGTGAEDGRKQENTPSKKAPSGVGSPPSEPQEKRPMISSEHADENEEVGAEDNSGVAENGSNCKEGANGHLEGKCPDGPLADCKQKLNNASKQSKEMEKPDTETKVNNGDKMNGDSKEPETVEVEEQQEDEPAEEEEEDEDSDESGSGSSSSQEDEEEAEEEESSEHSSDDSDQIYKEMMEDELHNEDSSEDSNEDEDFESRKIHMKRMKALGLLGGAALRRSIMAHSGIVDADDDSEEIEEEEEGEENGDALGPLKVRGGPDIEFLSPPDERVPGVGSGATAIVAVVRGDKLYVANAGDSRCIIYKDGKTVAMSFDHKPDDAIELKRITTAGGRVTPDGRVMGGLNLSRAVGDHLYKRNQELSLEEQMVTSKPDIKSIDTNGAEFMVLACDGIWNSMTNEEVGDFVHARIGSKSLVQICSDMFDHCLAPSTAGDGTGCDNMTAVIVRFIGKGANIETEVGGVSRPSIEQPQQQV